MNENILQKIVKVLSGEAPDEEVEECKKINILVRRPFDTIFWIDWCKANKN